MNKDSNLIVYCTHCGDSCTETITDGTHSFCCEGCKQVYEILQETDACDPEKMQRLSGITPKGRFTQDKWNFLDEEVIAEKLILFSDKQHTHIQFSLPQIHCSSCIWLLEHLSRINKFVISSTVDFDKKEIIIIIDKEKIKLSTLASLLDYIGYPPSVSFESNEKKPIAKTSKQEIIRIGVAGFCFSNIMMLSFPDYLSGDGINETILKEYFSYISLLLSLPVLFYAAAPFFIQAWKGLRQKWLNIDAPIALAILITFSRSLYEITMHVGTGYLDSMSGIVFFMLIGRWFQLKTHHAVSFERDYKSYFPLSVQVIDDHEKKYKTIDKIVKDDIMLVRNHELIPADSILKNGKAFIDYSFVTGESEPVHIEAGKMIYAGGKQIGTGIELQVLRPVSSSQLTRLWNNDIFHNKKNREASFIHPWSNYFSIALFSIAIIATIFWQLNNPNNTWKALTSILIVACPCSLLLSATFTYGNLMRIFGKNKFFLKNANVIERIGDADAIVFDKTGTLTSGDQSSIKYKGKVLSYHEAMMIKAIVTQSNHPLSKALTNWSEWNNMTETDEISSYSEIPGKGIQATVLENNFCIGNAEFVFEHINDKTHLAHSENASIHISINNQYKGCFTLEQNYREHIFQTIQQITKRIPYLHILSGDNNKEELRIRKSLGSDAQLAFSKSPEEKLEYIKALQHHGKKVIMVGDGLNDAGALQQSDVGIAVTDNSTHFTPACDAILEGSQLKNLDKLFKLARTGKKIVTASFILSIGYNIVGLYFATQALLSPLIAAILMPASSISIILLVTLLGSLYARKYELERI